MKTPLPDISAFLAETVNAVRDRVDLVPRVGVVVGAELVGLSERLRNATRIPYGELPHMPTSGGDLSLGFVDDVPVACLEGRAHLGEGLPGWQLVHGVRTLARLGVKTILVAEAAGILEPTWNVGDLMLVVDHLNLTLHEGLGGVADQAFETFPNMRAAYDSALRDELHEVVRTENMLSARIGKNAPLELVEGIYAGLPDPSYETPAQMRMLRGLGAHAVGFGTVLEVVAARQLGLRVAAISYLSYRAADGDQPSLDDEITSRSGLTHFHRLVRGWIVRAYRA